MLFQGKKNLGDDDDSRHAKVQKYGAARSTTGPKLAAAMAAAPPIVDSDVPESQTQARLQQQAKGVFAHMNHDVDCADLQDFVAPKLRSFDGRILDFG